MARKHHGYDHWVVIDGCACRIDWAPYIWLVLREAGFQASAIYRGQDPVATAILNHFGKHTQKQLVDASPAQRRAWGVEGTPNPVGFSQHEERSDGIGNPNIDPGHPIPPYFVGIDAGGDDFQSRARITKAARHYGWRIKHPYHSGVEGHHWCFAVKPRARRFSRLWWKVVRVRRQLRREAIHWSKSIPALR